jgi:hypothetical protein
MAMHSTIADSQRLSLALLKTDQNLKIASPLLG